MSEPNWMGDVRMPEETAEYHEQRARQEAEAAEAADSPEAVMAHRRLATEHEERAKALRSGLEEEAGASVKRSREKLTLGHVGRRKDS
ncbi:hypothetical protein [Sphingomonas sp. CCH9-F2]|uniref:hypothetical protein n=1 Tax=Sphingomonas sp. CCH9-F2 TaxID=1768778 RepID=UPI0012E35BEE|nr:hypothetical protein [Sphingomonas sp. CCH9-F2]